jgi:hypothetical protein
MKLFYKMCVVIMLVMSTNAFCFLGEIVRDVVGGTADVAADTVDTVTGGRYYYDGDYYYHPRGYRYHRGYYYDRYGNPRHYRHHRHYYD